jgi:lipoate-protein ligase A
MTTWRLIDSGPGESAFNMALDEALALSVRAARAPITLRLYRWDRPAVTLGAFQKTADLDHSFCEQASIPILRRPTGGRAILHGDEVTYSFAAPHEGRFRDGLLRTYHALAEVFIAAFRSLGIPCTMKNHPERGNVLMRSPLCFRSVSFGEITSNGNKLVGSAQRRWTDGFLQQGSIPLSIDSRLLEQVFPAASREHRQVSFSGLHSIKPGIDSTVVQHALKRSFEETFGVSLVQGFPTGEELELARQLAEGKYRSPAWTREGRRAIRSGNNK